MHNIEFVYVSLSSTGGFFNSTYDYINNYVTSKLQNSEGNLPIIATPTDSIYVFHHPFHNAQRYADNKELKPDFNIYPNHDKKVKNDPDITYVKDLEKNRERSPNTFIEIKRLESRLILELCLLTLAGLIPPIALLI